MSASESAAVPASERDVPAAPRAVAGVSMRELLAACAAAEAVSRPPRAPLGDPDTRSPYRAA
ncbi:hypothetical protein ACFWJM_30515 [Streptomyces sp. NPDC127077]|uniref:hypothetical protein n=1 Tax=Streptomyces sp. NPDC127077 TaxID=3347131 RepID=UPI00364B0C1E